MQRILFFGPLADEYSFAKVNRGLALALNQLVAKEKLNLEIKISADKNDVAKLPGENEFQRYPGLKEIYEPYDPAKTWDLVVYNNFPKDPSAPYSLSKLNAKVKTVYQAWEEDLSPSSRVKELNYNCNFVIVASEHTKRVYHRSGVNIPIVVVPNALDDKYFNEQLLQQLSTKSTRIAETSKNFKFLHVSSGLERKGPKELISAYTSEFSAEDDVCLIIKSFPSNGNQFQDLVAAAKRDPSNPEIQLIDNEDLTEEQMIQLYLESDAYISPSKAEGFNLPVLEAMQIGVPVITTAWSGQMDFVSDETGYLVDYNLTPAKSHLDNPGAFWAEVVIDDLKMELRAAYSDKSSEKQKNLIAKAKVVGANYTWENSAKQLNELLSETTRLSDTKKLRFGIVSTYNSICGIAEYSGYLYENIINSFDSVHIFANRDAIGRQYVDNKYILRVWEYDELDFAGIFNWLDINKVDDKSPIDVMHIQYSEGFYTFDALRTLIEGLVVRNIKVIFTPHGVQVEGLDFSYIKDSLEKISELHVLNQNDVAYFESLGLKNVIYFPHGNITFPNQSKSRLKQKLGLPSDAPVVATHGFMSEGKGIMEVLEAVKKVSEKHESIVYLAVNAVSPKNITSQSLSDQFAKKIKELKFEDNVIHISDFLEREEILTLLAAADLNIFAYPEARQTASGAIRLAMAVGRPIIATDSFQLGDIQEIIYKITRNQPSEIAEAITQLLTDSSKYFESQMKVRAAQQRNSWDRLQIKYLGLVANLQSES